MRTIFLIVVFLCMWDLSGSQSNTDVKILAKDTEDTVTFTCENGKKWKRGNENVSEDSTLKLSYMDANSGEYTCNPDSTPLTIFVKFRTCENCIDLDAGTVAGLICGDLVATFLIGVAVYFVASQSKSRPHGSNYSKASDRQNLIQNQQNDTYMPLTQGHSSEYSKLERRANRK